MSNSDHDIVQQVLAGNREAFAHLIERYKTRIFQTTYRMLKNREDAEDAAQDTFVRAYRGLAKFRADAAFATWLYKICYNVCLNCLEKRRNAKPRAAEAELARLPDPDAPDHVFADRERKTMVEDALEDLPEHFRSVLILYHAQQLSYQQIAEILNLPINTVKTHLFRGRALLRRRILQKVPQKDLIAELL